MAGDDETVADVLEAIRTPAAGEKLANVVFGDLDPDQLTFEDWVRPMKLTGGRVCLEIRHGDSEPAWAQWTPNGLEVRDRDRTPDMNPVDVVNRIKTLLPRDDWAFEAVLREDTPFGEGD